MDAVYYQDGIKERPWGRTKQQDISQPSQRGATGQTEPGSHPKDGTLKISWESALHMGCVSWRASRKRRSQLLEGNTKWEQGDLRILTGRFLSTSPHSSSVAS